MYVVREQETDKCAVIREQKRLSNYIGASVGTIRNNHSKRSWTWGKYVIYNPIHVDLGTRKQGNAYNFVKRFDNN